MRKLLILPVFLALTLVLSSCAQIAEGRVDIDRLFITRIFSLDNTQEGKVLLTLTTKDLSTGGGGQQPQQKGASVVSEGDTVFDAARNLIIYSDRRPHYGHTEYIIFGEPIARKGIKPYLDFVSRQSEFRYNAKLYIVKGGTANSMVKKTNTTKMFIGDRLSNLEENLGLTSLASMVTLNEALTILDQTNLGVFIPYLEVAETMSAEEKDKYDILLRGYAIFRGDKLLYFTSMKEARGINWMMDRVKSGIIIVKNKLGEEISLEITDNKVKVKPVIQGDEMQCIVDVSFTTNISEILGIKGNLNKEGIKQLIDLQNKAIKEEVEYAINMAQDNNSDHFSTVSRFIIEYPMLKNYFLENWGKLFPDIKFEVKVQSNIKGTYMINEPSGRTEDVEGE